MSNADVMKAKSLHDEMVGWEIRGPGDLANAMSRLATRYALPIGKQWALRYRPPKEIASHLFARIEAAHAAEKRRQLRKLAHDAEITAVVTGPAHPAVRAGEALLRAADGQDPGSGEGVAAAVFGAGRRSDGCAPQDLNDLPPWRGVSEE